MPELTVRPDDPALRWAGAIEVEHTPRWSRAWRLPHSRIDLFSDEFLCRVAMGAGVRVCFITDSTAVGGQVIPGDAPDELSPIDLVVDGATVHTTTIQDASFQFTGLPGGEKSIELWLPQFGDFRLAHLLLDASASVPAPMVARMIRDLPADVITTCLGINVYGPGTFTARSFLPAVLGFLSTIRDRHPNTPILVISPIYSPEREDQPGGGGMTLQQIRHNVGEGVHLLQKHGAMNVQLLNGLDVLGPEHEDRLFDNLHPDAEGYELMAERIKPAVKDLAGRALSGAD